MKKLQCCLRDERIYENMQDYPASGAGITN